MILPMMAICCRRFWFDPLLWLRQQVCILSHFSCKLQREILHESCCTGLEWPPDLLQRPAAAIVSIQTPVKRVIFRGLRVRVGIHTGMPEQIVVRHAQIALQEGLLWLMMMVIMHLP